MKSLIIPKRDIFNPFSIPVSSDKMALMEGYYATYDMEKVKQYLDDRYNGGADIYIMDNDNGERVFRIITANNEENKEIIDRDMSMVGYFPSYIEEKGDIIDIQYEPRHQNKINQIVSERPYIYHLTKATKLDNIFKNGLFPKTNNKMFLYPDRIYFFLDKPDDEVCKMLMQQFYGAEKREYYMALQNKKEKAQVPYDKEYALLKVDTKQIRNIDFYYDPNAEGGIYCKDNITPKAIKLVKLVSF